jgi:hypothetical protein
MSLKVVEIKFNLLNVIVINWNGFKTFDID